MALVPGKITLAQMIQQSLAYYKKFDDKAKRAKSDIISVRVYATNNLTKDPSTRTWVQTGRNIRITAIVKSDPKSYRKRDTVKVHSYPVTFLLHDVDKGTETYFRWRTGSNYKPQILPAAMVAKMNPARKQAYLNYNVNKQIQMQFFFELEWVLRQWGLLFGPNWATYPPRKANPKNLPFLDKHAYHVLQQIILPLLKDKKLVTKLVKQTSDEY